MVKEARGVERLAGDSAAMKAVRDVVMRVARRPFGVLVQGETGTGKELVARAVHEESHRRGELVVVNCGRVGDELWEAEIFGHEKGAFTGAIRTRRGLVAQAVNGTLFLDEVGELSSRQQVGLLRVLDSGEVRRVGGNAVERVNTRLVAATNQTLRPSGGKGESFRRDLLFRLEKGMRILVPALRERRVDIPLLAVLAWRAANPKMDRYRSGARLSAAAIKKLMGYQWPGNVRELQGVMQQASVMGPDKGEVPISALRAEVQAAPTPRLNVPERRAVEAAMAMQVRGHEMGELARSR